MAVRETAPRGRNEVVPAVLAACERLCERTVPARFTIIDLAEEAGITTSLLYFYFDSKEAIVLATMQAIANEADQVASEHEDPADMVDAVRRFMWVRPAFPRMATALYLEGHDITELMGSHPFLERLIPAAASMADEDPVTYAGKAIIGIMAAATIGRGVNRAIGRDPDDPRIAGIEDA